MTSPVQTNLDTITLRLIHTPDAELVPSMTRDSIRYLLKALVHADAPFTAEIETVLVKSAAISIPELVKALSNPSLNVKSTAAMALIRIGIPAEQALLRAYQKAKFKPSLKWIFDFVLQELSLMDQILVFERYSEDQMIRTTSAVF